MADTPVLSKDDRYSVKGNCAENGKDGGKYLKGSIYPYEAMVRTENDTLFFSFVPASNKTVGKQVFVLGAPATDTYAQFEVEFLNGKANLYESYKGGRILLVSENFALKTDGTNDVTYSVKREAKNKTVLKLSVNNRVLFHSAITHLVDNSRIQYISSDSGIILY